MFNKPLDLMAPILDKDNKIIKKVKFNNTFVFSPHHTINCSKKRLRLMLVTTYSDILKGSLII